MRRQRSVLATATSSQYNGSTDEQRQHAAQGEDREDRENVMPATSGPAITDIPGLLVGHAHDDDALTGCTVVLTTGGAVAGVDVRGGGPGTRETDLLTPQSAVGQIHGIALCGGSAFGLAAATGVVQWLYERDIGHPTPATRVPLVPAAVIFDLMLGRSDRWADAELGYAACDAASSTTPEGCVGVGIGATVGKVLGKAAAIKSGLGTWSETLADGTIIGALAVCNAFGDVWRHEQVLAGVRNLEGGGFANAMQVLRRGEMSDLFRSRRPPRALPDIANTTLAVVATNASLNKAEASKLAQMAQNALARTIRPVHTPFDGDTVFTLSVGEQSAPHMTVLGSVAADVLATAIQRAVTEATSLGGLPAIRDL
jgi:L-aminopeptidase/D-esterase-like protein